MNDNRKIEIAEISGIMCTVGGRNFINNLLDMTGVFNDTFSNDTHEHARNAGARQIGLRIIEEIKTADFGNYIQLMKERDKR